MRSFLIRVLKVAFSLASVVVIGIALLPALLKTDWGKKQAVKLINHFIPGKMEIDSFNLNWLKGQSIEGIRFEGFKEKVIIDIGELSAAGSLWSFLTGKFLLDPIQIQELQAVFIEDSQIPICLLHVNAECSFLKENHALSASIQGFTQDGNLDGSFEIDITWKELEGSRWKEWLEGIWQHWEQEVGRAAAIRANFHHFPIHLLDQLSFFKDSRFNQIFQAFFGKHLDLKIEKKANSLGFWSVDAQAPGFQVEVKGRIVDQLLTIEEPLMINWSLTPLFFNSFSSRTQLYTEIPIQIVVPFLSIPLQFFKSKGATDFCLCGFDVNLMIPKIDIQMSRIGTINVDHLKAQVSSLANSSHFLLKVIGRAEYYRKPTTINYEIKLDKPADFYAFLQIFSKM